MFVKKKNNNNNWHVFVWQILSDYFIRSFYKFKLQPSCMSRFPIYFKIIIINIHVWNCSLQVKESYCKIILLNVYINAILWMCAIKNGEMLHVLSLITHIHPSRLLLNYLSIMCFQTKIIYCRSFVVHDTQYW